MSPPCRSLKSRLAFTLLEVLVSFAILSIVFVALLSLLNLTATTFRRTSNSLEAFASARTAFDALTQTLRRATLLSYIGYNDPVAPTAYGLKSDLHFLCGEQGDLGLTKTGMGTSGAVFFQAPLGLAEGSGLNSANTLLCATGFFLAWGGPPSYPAVLDAAGQGVPLKRRCRLYQYFPPRERLAVYGSTIAEADGIPVAAETFKGSDWFVDDVDALRHCHLLAENVVVLAILPLVDGQPAQSYLWNSRDAAAHASLNRMPDAIRVVLVAIDEQSMASLGEPVEAPIFLPASGDGTIFSNPASFEGDLASLEQYLANFTPRLNYRIFKADVPLTAR